MIDQDKLKQIEADYNARTVPWLPEADVRWLIERAKLLEARRRKMVVCPDCSAEMIQTEIVDEDGDVWLVWLCRCESEEVI